MKDAIGDRLDHPERVPPEYRHLIPDDQQRVKRLLAFDVSGDVLDVGCSDGAITRRIQAAWPKATVRGVDLLDWDIRQPWPHHTRFDTIFCCEVLEHLTDADAQTALQNLVDILKPGGSLIVTVPNRDCDERYVAGCRDRWRWPDHRSAWWPAKLQRLLKGPFADLQWQPLHDEDTPWESIWFIVRAVGRR